jgi:CHAT domain-containing protein/tetratricopeptide (TPR) repeat protein
MSRAQTARALSLLMKGVEAFEARDLKMAAAAMAMAADINENRENALAMVLAEARQAILRDDRKGLLQAVAKAAEAAAAPEAPAAAAQATPLQMAAAPAPPLTNLPPAPASRAVILLGEAAHAMGRGDPAAALDALDYALMSSEADAEDVTVGEAFGRLGISLADARFWGPARQAIERGLAIKMRVLGKSHRRIAPELTALSNLCEQLGEYDEALRLAERALTIRRLQSNGAPKDLADSLVQYAKAALGLEDYAVAAACLREALALGRDARAADLWVAGVLDQLGLAVARLEDDAAARALHEQAFALRRPKLPRTHPDIGRSLVHIGGFLLGDGAYDEARTHFQAAREIFEALGPEEVLGAAQCLENLAVLEVRRQNLEPGRQLLVSAVARLRDAFGPDQRLVLKFETELAFLTLFTGDLAGAAALGYAVLRRARAAHHANLRRDLWYLLSQLADSRREMEAAIVFGKLAANAVHFQPGGVTRLETPLQRLFAARHGDVFRHLTVLLVKADRLPEAGRAMAMLKEDELFDMLRRDPARDPRQTHMILNAAEARWQGEGDDIMRAREDAGREDWPPEEARRRRDDAEFRFEPWLKSAQARCVPPAAVESHAGLAELGARVALLHMVAAPGRLHLLLATTEFQVAREVDISASALRRLALGFRHAVETQNAESAALGAALHAHLIAPVAEIYRELGIKTLLIAAEGWLRYVPFAALHDGTAYLAETMATVLLTEAWPAESAYWPEKLTIAALGDASAAAELRALVRGAPGVGIWPGAIATDAQFSATSLSDALAERQIVHVASRAVLDARRPAESYLTLGDGAPLPFGALSQMPYYFRDVALMTLSGCETQAGDDAGDGSEVEALGALLRRRGAGSVLAGHWRPPAAAATALMAAFYAPRKGRKLASAALIAAQREMLAGAFKHPYYWAGYFVLGGTE